MIDSNQIKTFLRDELDVDISEIAEDTPLFSSGIVDSFSMVSIMALLEDEGGIRISPSEVTVDNLDSVSRMIDYVQSKTP